MWVGSCVTNNGLQYEAVSSTNLYHIARVQKGMGEKQVLQIMHKPYQYESFEVCGDIYDVWFYVTKTTGLDQSRMVPQNLTPLTFKNGVLVGTGYYWYYFAMREQAAELATKNPPPKKPKSQDDEDKEFEKALDDLEKTRSKTSTQTTEAGQPSVKPLGSIIKPWNAPLGVSPRAFSKIPRGMSETEVSNAIGPPSGSETLQVDEDVYDVWFYDITPSKKTMTPKKVPIIFKNGAVSGKGMNDYNDVRKAAGQDNVDGYGREGERMQEDDSDQNFNFW